MKSSEVDQREPLISEKKRFPEVFKWKVAAIVITVMIAVFIIVDVILFVNYNNDQTRKINYSFARDVIRNYQASAPVLSRQALANMLIGLTASYSDIWYQSASLVSSWNGPPLSVSSVGSFFKDSNPHQLTIIEFSGVNNYQIAVYTHIGFPLPKDDWTSYLINPLNRYFTFEIDDRQSTIVGGASQGYIRMSGSTSNLLNCTIISFRNNDITYLQSMKIDFSNNLVPTFNFLQTPQSICFDGQPNFFDFMNKIQSISGITDTTILYSLSKVHVFSLSK